MVDYAAGPGGSLYIRKASILLFIILYIVNIIAGHGRIHQQLERRGLERQKERSRGKRNIEGCIGY